jgi:hypothetical protein
LLLIINYDVSDKYFINNILFTVRTRALVHITDIITKPLIQTFEKKIALNKLRTIHLQKQLQELQRMYNG